MRNEVVIGDTRGNMSGRVDSRGKSDLGCAWEAVTGGISCLFLPVPACLLALDPWKYSGKHHNTPCSTGAL